MFLYVFSMIIDYGKQKSTLKKCKYVKAMQFIDSDSYVMPVTGIPAEGTNINNDFLCMLQGGIPATKSKKNATHQFSSCKDDSNSSVVEDSVSLKILQQFKRVNLWLVPSRSKWQYSRHINSQSSKKGIMYSLS